MPTPDKSSIPDGLPRFALGRLVATPAALTVLIVAKVPPHSLLRRHVRGDWGDLDAQDRKENERALAQGTRLLSSYRLPDGETVWIITEADRSATTLLLPVDY